MKFLIIEKYSINIKELSQSHSLHLQRQEQRPPSYHQAVWQFFFGVVVGAPLAEIAGLSGFCSTFITVGSKRLNKKISKHEKTVAFAKAKHLSISRLILKALNDGRISDAEFDLILKEVEQYKVLKKGLRNVDAQNYIKLVNIKN